MKKDTKKSQRRFVVQFTMADRLLATPQRLRADESVSSTTMALLYAAKWHQAGRTR